MIVGPHSDMAKGVFHSSGAGNTGTQWVRVLISVTGIDEEDSLWFFSLCAALRPKE